MTRSISVCILVFVAAVRSSHAATVVPAPAFAWVDSRMVENPYADVGPASFSGGVPALLGSNRGFTGVRTLDLQLPDLSPLYGNSHAGKGEDGSVTLVLAGMLLVLFRWLQPAFSPRRPNP